MINFQCLIDKGLATSEELAGVTQLSSGSARDLLRLFVVLKLRGLEPEVITLSDESVTLDGEDVVL